MNSRFQVLEKLGQGGMGGVYKAEDLVLRRAVALKFLTGSNAADPAVRLRFLREAQAGASLDHPNICPVYGFDQAEGQCFIVMAFLPGETLARRLASGVTLRQAIDWTIAIGEGLKHAHDRGVLHRDIKAANIILTDSERPCITDFGLARIQDRSRLTRPGTLMGTLHTLAPEQLLKEDADRRTDIWALGILLLEMLIGRPPFRRADPHTTMQAILREPAPALASVIPELPHELQKTIRKATAKSPADRYQRVDDFTADLRAVREHLTPEQQGIALPPFRLEGATTRTVTGIARLPRVLRRPIVAASIVLFLLLVGAILYMVR